MYILLNGKSEILYDYAFQSVIDLITSKRSFDLNIKTIIADSEKALINVIKKFFPNSQSISCFFHYKQDILRNLRSYGLYKKNDKEISNIIIKDLSSLPFDYKGDLEHVKSKLRKITSKYPNYTNLINNYFIENKLEYFKDLSLDYSRIPKDCRMNNYLENYNGYLKNKLGKNGIINWANFIYFLKCKSKRSIEKLINNNNIISVNLIKTIIIYFQLNIQILVV